MPNSARAFLLWWAPQGVLPPRTNSISASDSNPNAHNGNGNANSNTNGSANKGAGQGGTGNLQYPKEYSIFVGDLAPETSKSDLVAVSGVLCFLFLFESRHSLWMARCKY